MGALCRAGVEESGENIGDAQVLVYHHRRIGQNVRHRSVLLLRTPHGVKTLWRASIATYFGPKLREVWPVHSFRRDDTHGRICHCAAQPHFAGVSSCNFTHELVTVNDTYGSQCFLKYTEDVGRIYQISQELITPTSSVFATSRYRKGPERHYVMDVWAGIEVTSSSARRPERADAISSHVSKGGPWLL